MRFVILLICFSLTFSTVKADEKLDKVLSELQQIKKDLSTLEKAVYSQSFKGSSGSQQSGSLEGALTRQLVKITEIEEQMQKLTASHEEVLFSFEQLNERINKVQKDNELRLSALCPWGGVLPSDASVRVILPSNSATHLEPRVQLVLLVCMVTARHFYRRVVCCIFRIRFNMGAPSSARVW